MSTEHSGPDPRPSIHLTHLNHDATFLLTYTASPNHKSYTLLLDPWLVGESPVIHPAFSTQSHTVPPALAHLSHLSASPDLVLISQDKSDHCNEATLRMLDTQPGGRDAATKCWAVNGAIGKVRRWGMFAKDKVGELKAWKKGDRGNGVDGEIVREETVWGCNTVVVPIPLAPVGEGAGLPSPPSSSSGSDSDSDSVPGSDTTVPIAAHVELTYLPAIYPWQFPSIHSAIAIRFVTLYPSRPASRTIPNIHTYLTFLTPHGLPPNSFVPFLQSLPSTPTTPKNTINLLLHPFTLTTTPQILGGEITHGVPGVEAYVAAGVKVKLWVSCHDEEKEVGGFVASKIRTVRWKREIIRERDGVRGCCGGEDEIKDGGGVDEVWELENGEGREVGMF